MGDYERKDQGAVSYIMQNNFISEDYKNLIPP
jgi:hypothetical protein